MADNSRVGQGYWRYRSREVISTIIQANDGKPEAEMRKLISLAYPFGERRNHPYKIWLDEVKRQMDCYLARLRGEPIAVQSFHQKRIRPVEPAPGQGVLF